MTDAELQATVAAVREALARPNDWPLPDDETGFWVPRPHLAALCDAVERLTRERDAIREAWRVCGSLQEARRFAIVSAYDDESRNFGYQLAEVKDPEAKVRRYVNIPGTFRLDAADVALLAVERVRAGKRQSAPPRGEEGAA